MHNYPGPGMREPGANRVSVLGEFGGLGMPVSGHTWQDEKNWGYVSYDNEDELTDAYVDLLTMMRPLIGHGLSAAVYTQTTDVEIEVNGLHDVRSRAGEDGRGADHRGGARSCTSRRREMRVLAGDERDSAADVALHDDEAGPTIGRGRFRRQRVEDGPGGFGAGEARRVPSSARDGRRPISGCAGRSRSSVARRAAS